MFRKVKKLLFGENSNFLESYLKKISVNRHDLIGDVSHFDRFNN
jgi:hypothetical protein